MSSEVEQTIDIIKGQLNSELADIGSDLRTAYGQSLAWARVRITSRGNGVFAEPVDWHSMDDQEIEVWVSPDLKHYFYLFVFNDNVVAPATAITRRVLANRGWHLARIMDVQEFNEWANRSEEGRLLAQ